MTTAVTETQQAEIKTIRGEVTQTPHLVERTAAKDGAKFNTAALRYWDENDEDFGVISASYDLAHRVVNEAVAGTKFVASVLKDTQYTNLRDIRFLSGDKVSVEEPVTKEEVAG